MRASGGLDFRNLGGAPVDVAIHGQYYEFPQEDFFGIGRDSLEDNRTNHLLDNVEGGASVRWRPATFWELGGGASYLSPRIGVGTDGRFPSTGDVIDPAALPGLAAQPDFLKADVSAAFDWRDNPLHSHNGGRYGVTFPDSMTGISVFTTSGAWMSACSSTCRCQIAIACSRCAEAVLADADAGHEVSFYLQPTLGGAKNLRGYQVWFVSEHVVDTPVGRVDAEAAAEV